MSKAKAESLIITLPNGNALGKKMQYHPFRPYFNSNEQITIENSQNPNNIQAGTNIMADYQLTDKQTLGFMLNGQYQKKTDDRIAETFYRQLNVSDIDSIIHSDTKLRTPISNFSANLNYRLKTDSKGSQLSLDLDYLRNDKDAKTYNDFSMIERNIMQDYYARFVQQSKDYTNNFSGKAEYNQVIDKKNTVMAGIELYSLNSTMNYFYGNMNHEEYVNDLRKSNQSFPVLLNADYLFGKQSGFETGQTVYDRPELYTEKALYSGI